MTLVLTELSPLGIAMAADSAVTIQNMQTGYIRVLPSAAVKLQPIPYLNAGISCWGLGKIENKSTDDWIMQFIDTHRNITTLGDFAVELAASLNAVLPPNTNGDNRIGFHLAGYEDFNGIPLPSFYHVHDGPSTVLANRGVSVNPNQVNANHDMPPNLFISMQRRGEGWIMRNGDYILYANIFGLLESFFKQLIPLGIQIPNSQNLDDRAEYLVFQIRTVSEIYRMSNLIPGIGGQIDYMTINSNGIRSQGSKYF